MSNKKNNNNLPAKRRGKLWGAIVAIGVAVISALGIHNATAPKEEPKAYTSWEKIPEGDKGNISKNQKTMQEKEQLEQSTEAGYDGKEQTIELDNDEFVDELLDYFKQETGQSLDKDDIGFISTTPQYSYYDWTDETHKIEDDLLNKSENLIEYAQNGWINIQESYNDNHSGVVGRSIQGYGVVYKPSKKIIASIGKIGEEVIPFTIAQHFTSDRTEYDKSAYIIDLYSLESKDENWEYTPEECYQIIEDEVNQKTKSTAKNVTLSDTKADNGFRESIKVSEQTQANLENKTIASKQIETRGSVKRDKESIDKNDGREI